MRKLAFVIPGIILIGFIGTCIYFVAGVSATIPPIKKYQFSGSSNQLITAIKSYTDKNLAVTYKITDTTGNMKDGYAFYIDVNIRVTTDSNLYTIKLSESDESNRQNGTDVDLISAFNTQNTKIGGYGIDGIGVKKLVKYFDTAFLVKLRLPIKPVN